MKEFSDLYAENYVSEASLKLFYSLIKVKKYRKGDILIRQGDTLTNYYILKSGIVRGYTTTLKGKEFIKTLYFPIDTISSLGASLDPKGSEFSCDCLTDCEVVEGNFNDLRHAIKTNHELCFLYAKVIEKAYIRSDKRIYELSALDSKARYLKLRKDILNIDGLISQYHIASYLGITPVQLSRIRKSLILEDR